LSGLPVDLAIGFGPGLSAMITLLVAPEDATNEVNLAGIELTPRSWTSFKGSHEEARNKVQAQGR
jgi:hypothetical protein